MWSAGGGSGKEAYSAAILLHEICPSTAHEIVATDKDERMLAIGRAGGPYSAHDVETLSDEEKATYLRNDTPPYFVSDRLRAMVSFTRHDLLTDGYPADRDWILYRDVEPFFSVAQRAHVYRRLHAALAPGGLLFMGAVERIANPEAYGLRFADSNAIYERTA